MTDVRAHVTLDVDVVDGTHYRWTFDVTNKADVTKQTIPEPVSIKVDFVGVENEQMETLRESLS